MGLDSVELLMRFEKEFKKDVPDEDAATLYTVGDVANWFFNNLVIHSPDKGVKQQILDKLQLALQTLNPKAGFKENDVLKDFIPKENLKSFWRDLEFELKLKIPKLNPQDFTEEKLKDIKILGITISRPKQAVLDMQFSRFAECIGAINYEKLVDFDTISSLFEITIATIAITHEQCGVAIDEIFVTSSFTNDLGID